MFVHLPPSPPPPGSVDAAQDLVDRLEWLRRRELRLLGFLAFAGELVPSAQCRNDELARSIAESSQMFAERHLGIGLSSPRCKTLLHRMSHSTTPHARLRLHPLLPRPGDKALCFGAPQALSVCEPCPAWVHTCTLTCGGSLEWQTAAQIPADGRPEIIILWVSSPTFLGKGYIKDHDEAESDENIV